MKMKKIVRLTLGFGAILLAPMAMARLQSLADFRSADSKAASRDRNDLVRRALAQGSLEVDAGWLAVKRSADPDIVEFGRKMANSHDASNKQLIVIADRLGIASSEKLDEERADKIEKLRNTDASSFDALFLKGQIEAHEEMSALFSAVLRNEDSRELSSFARERLDMINGHLDEARELQEKLA